jgi:hypothetical protein
MQADVPSPPLDLTQERPMNAGLMGQRFLTKAQLLPPGANPFAKDLGGWRDWLCHCLPNDIRPNYLCPETIHPMSLSPKPLRPATVRRYVCIDRP